MTLSLEEARRCLAVSAQASSDERLAAHATQRRALEARLTDAPTEGLKAKYREALTRVDEAIEVLEVADMLSVTTPVPDIVIIPSQDSVPPDKLGAAIKVAPAYWLFFSFYVPLMLCLSLTVYLSAFFLWTESGPFAWIAVLQMSLLSETYNVFSFIGTILFCMMLGSAVLLFSRWLLSLRSRVHVRPDDFSLRVLLNMTAPVMFGVVVIHGIAIVLFTTGGSHVQPATMAEAIASASFIPVNVEMEQSSFSELAEASTSLVEVDNRVSESPKGGKVYFTIGSSEDLPPSAFLLMRYERAFTPVTSFKMSNSDRQPPSPFSNGTFRGVMVLSPMPFLIRQNWASAHPSNPNAPLFLPCFVAKVSVRGFIWPIFIPLLTLTLVGMWILVSKGWRLMRGARS